MANQQQQETNTTQKRPRFKKENNSQLGLEAVSL